MDPQTNPKEWALHVKGLSAEFADLLRSDIGAIHLSKVVRLNRLESNPSVCHSHDFTDANIIMANAYGAVFDKSPTQEDQYLIECAWNKAKEFDFYL